VARPAVAPYLYEVLCVCSVGSPASIITTWSRARSTPSPLLAHVNPELYSESKSIIPRFEIKEGS
jgi:hypothetical protein